MSYKKLIFTGLIYGAISLLLLLASGFVQFIYSVYLKNPNQIEKYAREKYFMKKENEDIYIIEFEGDTVDKK